MNELLRNLFGGDLRSDGRASDVAREVIRNSRPLSSLVQGLSD